MLFIEEVLCVWKEMQNQNKGNCSRGREGSTEWEMKWLLAVLGYQLRAFHW